MADRSFLHWPFFEDEHRRLARELDSWAATHLGDAAHDDLDAACRALVAMLGDGGWLAHAVPAARAHGNPVPDVRALCLGREILARHDALADFAFAMQGLGCAAIALHGSPALQAAYLEPARRGERIAAFALSEPDAGSDVAALTTTATADGEDYVLDGIKTWISNGGIADFYTVFARTGEAPGARGLSALVVDADTPGLEVVERIEVLAPHPLVRLRFNGCRVPRTHLLGAPGAGFAVAMATLDLFRASVGAAALGFARRALDEALAHASSRRMFGGVLADLQLTRARLADMAVDIDASALLVYRAAWSRDCRAAAVSREASMAKLYATEAAQRVVDAAVQLFGGLGVTRGVVVEALYREVRALRIYEGASEVQKLIIARRTLNPD